MPLSVNAQTEFILTNKAASIMEMTQKGKIISGEGRK
jgi:uncharacterized protein YjiK